MSKAVTFVLMGGPPWGFRISSNDQRTTTLKDRDATATVIAHVIPNSQAANKGVEVGDIVTSINGKSVQRLALAEVQNIIKSAVGVVKLSVTRNSAVQANHAYRQSTVVSKVSKEPALGWPQPWKVHPVPSATAHLEPHAECRLGPPKIRKSMASFTKPAVPFDPEMKLLHQTGQSGASSVSYASSRIQNASVSDGRPLFGCQREPPAKLDYQRTEGFLTKQNTSNVWRQQQQNDRADFRETSKQEENGEELQLQRSESAMSDHPSLDTGTLILDDTSMFSPSQSRASITPSLDDNDVVPDFEHEQADADFDANFSNSMGLLKIEVDSFSLNPPSRNFQSIEDQLTPTTTSTVITAINAQDTADNEPQSQYKSETYAEGAAGERNGDVSGPFYAEVQNMALPIVRRSSISSGSTPLSATPPLVVTMSSSETVPQEAAARRRSVVISRDLPTVIEVSPNSSSSSAANLAVIQSVSTDDQPSPSNSSVNDKSLNVDELPSFSVATTQNSSLPSTTSSTSPGQKRRRSSQLNQNQLEGVVSNGDANKTSTADSGSDFVMLSSLEQSSNSLAHIPPIMDSSMVEESMTSSSRIEDASKPDVSANSIPATAKIDQQKSLETLASGFGSEPRPENSKEGGSMIDCEQQEPIYASIRGPSFRPNAKPAIWSPQGQSVPIDVTSVYPSSNFAADYGSGNGTAVSGNAYNNWRDSNYASKPVAYPALTANEQSEVSYPSNELFGQAAVPAPQRPTGSVPPPPPPSIGPGIAKSKPQFVAKPAQPEEFDPNRSVVEYPEKQTVAQLRNTIQNKLGSSTSKQQTPNASNNSEYSVSNNFSGFSVPPASEGALFPNNEQTNHSTLVKQQIPLASTAFGQRQQSDSFEPSEAGFEWLRRRAEESSRPILPGNSNLSASVNSPGAAAHCQPSLSKVPNVQRQEQNYGFSGDRKISADDIWQAKSRLVTGDDIWQSKPLDANFTCDRPFITQAPSIEDPYVNVLQVAGRKRHSAGDNNNLTRHPAIFLRQGQSAGFTPEFSSTPKSYSCNIAYDRKPDIADYAYSSSSQLAETSAPLFSRISLPEATSAKPTPPALSEVEQSLESLYLALNVQVAALSPPAAIADKLNHLKQILSPIPPRRSALNSASNLQNSVSISGGAEFAYSPLRQNLSSTSASSCIAADTPLTTTTIRSYSETMPKIESSNPAATMATGNTTWTTYSGLPSLNPSGLSSAPAVNGSKAEHNRVGSESYYAVPYRDATARNISETAQESPYARSHKYAAGAGLDSRSSQQQNNAPRQQEQRSQQPWYKAMYKQLHQLDTKEDQDPVIRYRISANRAALDGSSYDARTHAPLSSANTTEEKPYYPKPYTATSYESTRDDGRRSRSIGRYETESPMPNNQIVKSTPSNAKYRIQPRSIENYIPGASTLAEYEIEKNRVQAQARPATALGFHSPSRYCEPRNWRSDSMSQPKSTRPPPDDVRELYKAIQNGGDVPFGGLRAPAPERTDSLLRSLFFMTCKMQLEADALKRRKDASAQTYQWLIECPDVASPLPTPPLCYNNFSPPSRSSPGRNMTVCKNPSTPLQLQIFIPSTENEALERLAAAEFLSPKSVASTSHSSKSCQSSPRRRPAVTKGENTALGFSPIRTRAKSLGRYAVERSHTRDFHLPSFRQTQQENASALADTGSYDQSFQFMHQLLAAKHRLAEQTSCASYADVRAYRDALLDAETASNSEEAYLSAFAATEAALTDLENLPEIVAQLSSNQFHLPTCSMTRSISLPTVPRSDPRSPAFSPPAGQLIPNGYLLSPRVSTLDQQHEGMLFTAAKRYHQWRTESDNEYYQIEFEDLGVAKPELSSSSRGIVSATTNGYRIQLRRIKSLPHISEADEELSLSTKSCFSKSLELMSPDNASKGFNSSVLPSGDHIVEVAPKSNALIQPEKNACCTNAVLADAAVKTNAMKLAFLRDNCINYVASFSDSSINSILSRHGTVHNRDYANHDSSIDILENISWSTTEENLNDFGRIQLKPSLPLALLPSATRRRLDEAHPISENLANASSERGFVARTSDCCTCDSCRKFEQQRNAQLSSLSEAGAILDVEVSRFMRELNEVEDRQFQREVYSAGVMTRSSSFPFLLSIDGASQLRSNDRYPATALSAHTAQAHKPWYRNYQKSIHAKVAQGCTASACDGSNVCPSDGNTFGGFTIDPIATHVSPRAVYDSDFRKEHCRAQPVDRLSSVGESRRRQFEQGNDDKRPKRNEFPGFAESLAAAAEVRTPPQARRQANYAGSSAGVLPRGNETLTIASPSAKYLYLAKALFDFRAHNAKELSFKKGDIIQIRQLVDYRWFEGELNGRIGILPTNYVKVIEKEEANSPVASATPITEVVEGSAKALFSFRGRNMNELNLIKNETIALIRRVDENWWDGRNSAGSRGIFPSNYVQVIKEPLLQSKGRQGNTNATCTIDSSVGTLQDALSKLLTNDDGSFSTRRTLSSIRSRLNRQSPKPGSKDRHTVCGMKYKKSTAS